MYKRTNNIKSPMKSSFWKMLLASVCGVFIASLLCLFLTFAFIGALAGGDKNPVLPKSGILRIDLSAFSIGEQSRETNPMEALQARGQISAVIGLRAAADALRAAAEDPSVQCAYLKVDGNVTDLTHLEEFRTALSAFRASGKAVVAYTDGPTTGSYYIASAADKVYMSANKGAGGMILGIGSQMFFLKDLLDRLGVNVQLIRHGKYKSAGEMFVRSSSSPENLEQNQAMIDGLWKSVAAAVAESRSISVSQLDQAIAGLKLETGEELIAHGLVDELVTREQMKDKLCALAGVEKYKDVKFIDFEDYVKVKSVPNYKARKKIAVIYADGEIVEGSDKNGVAGERFASVIARVRADSSVKAVVFRVNSPGGSVLASDKIKTEIDLMRAVKPVVASYGSYAASGGYWISNSCERIFSDATTLTGSIGVFSMIPDFSRTVRDIAHVNITSVKSHPHADMIGAMRPLDEAEKAAMQRSVEDIYGAFVSTVAAGRGLDSLYVDSIAQGRVWAGCDALERKLVDEIGTLDDALRYTAALAGDADLKAWNIVDEPKPQTQTEMLMELFGQKEDLDEQVLAALPGGKSLRPLLKMLREPGGKVLARIPYQITVQ